jgi:ABC-type nitrate/sulfonate/bicarbonate transport system substrate-binding protein
LDPITVLYRDPDRTPWLFALKRCAAQLGLPIEVQAAGREYGELLRDADAPVLAENYYALQALRARGAPIVCLATSITWMNERLFAAPEIEAIDDLHGRRFAVRGIQSSELIERLWLRDHGLAGDVEAVVYSDQDVGRWLQWTKVRDGECQACLVTDLYADPARDAGLREIPFELYGYLGNVTLTTHRLRVERDPSAAEALVRAAFDASRMIKHDPAAAMEIIEGEAQPFLRSRFPERSLDRIYEVLRDELPEYPVPSPDALSNMRRAAARAFPELMDFNPLLLWDLSFARKVADERDGPRLGI